MRLLAFAVIAAIGLLGARPALATFTGANGEIAYRSIALDADTDGDGIPDDADVCPLDFDPGQEDFDGDGAGDACDDDDDNDGMYDVLEFLNGTDPLDPDTDDDGVLDGQDICPTSPDPGQEDYDSDGLGNACDLDDDDDALWDSDEAAHGTNPFDPDSDDDGLRDGFEVLRGTNPLATDTDGDGLSDLVEVKKGMNPLDVDSDDDGVADAVDNCPLLANPGQQDQDGDGIGNVCDLQRAYSSWQLIGVTGDGASTAESLFALDTANASATFLMTLGNGQDGETITFNPADGLIYHASGIAQGGHFWESIDGVAWTIVTSQQFSGPDVGANENSAMVYHPATGRFLVSDLDNTFFDATLGGVATRLGTISGVAGNLKGLAFSGGVLRGAEAFANSLHQLDPATGLIISSVPVTLGGTAVNGMNGLATHPVTGALWGIFRVSNRRYLGTVNPDTGVATSVGQLPDNFAGITFMPEPSSSAGLAAGAIAVALGAMHRSRRRRGTAVMHASLADGRRTVNAATPSSARATS